MISTYLVDICTLDLTHRDEMVCEQVTIVISNSTNFCQTLVGVKVKLFPQILQILRVFTQHKPESFVLISQYFLLSPY